MKHSLLLRSLTPISHGDTSTGIDNSSNTRLFMRQHVVLNGVPVRVPSISENSLRSIMFRKPLADHLVSAVGAKSLPKTVVNLLYSGGNLMKGSKAPGTEFTLGRNLHRMYPHLELLSGATDNFVLPPGCLRVCAWIVAQEYIPALRHVAPENVLQDAVNVSAFDLVSEEIRTRGTGAESQGNQMLYAYEVLAQGAQIFIQVDIENGASELCRSAAGFAIAQWDRFIGGQSRQGRGLMAVEMNDLPCGKAYEQYVTDNAEVLNAGLTDGTFGTGTVLCGGN
jgi:hypothetical protein